MTMIFPADGTLLHFFFIGDVVWYHSIDYNFSLGSEC
jgi:hypothetical protein